MSDLATDSPEVTFLRGRVPEFEPRFAEELELDDELQRFMAVGFFGEWTVEQLHAGHTDVVQRACDAVEAMLADHSLRLGGDLSTEFIETVWREKDLYRFLGPGCLKILNS